MENQPRALRWELRALTFGPGQRPKGAHVRLLQEPLCGIFFETSRVEPRRGSHGLRKTGMRSECRLCGRPRVWVPDPGPAMGGYLRCPHTGEIWHGVLREDLPICRGVTKRGAPCGNHRQSTAVEFCGRHLDQAPTDEEIGAYA
jgi:hypothetical protein